MSYPVPVTGLVEVFNVLLTNDIVSFEQLGTDLKIGKD